MPDPRYIVGAGENGEPLFKAQALEQGWTPQEWEMIYALARLADAVFQSAQPTRPPFRIKGRRRG